MKPSDSVRRMTIDRILDNPRMKDENKVLLLRQYVRTRLADARVMAEVVNKVSAEVMM